MQTQRAIITATVHVPSVRADKPALIAGFLPKSVKVENMTVQPVKNHQNEATYRVTYGPVWGCWRSDLMKHFKRAAAKAGTSGSPAITTFKRDVVEIRKITPTLSATHSNCPVN